MNEPPAAVCRIVIMARPALGRAVEEILRGAGNEVHRTPGDGDLRSLVARLRPHLVIVALDIPWVDAIAAVQSLLDGSRRVSVLLLGTARSDPRLDGVVRLPVPVDPRTLLSEVNGLLTTCGLEQRE